MNYPVKYNHLQTKIFSKFMLVVVSFCEDVVFVFLGVISLQLSFLNKHLATLSVASLQTLPVKGELV